MRSFLLLFALLSIVSISFAQSDVDLQQAFLDLQHDGVVMNVSAHPDDEDGATLAYYRMKFGVATHSVFFTRGEGGQNEKGSELYEELGVLRTDETYAASMMQGTEAHFLNLMDFGYSKTATETLHKWGGRTEVLRRMVLMLRKLKPDIIFTHHNTVDGHGHHQVVAITVIAAFDAAADPTFFPEQLSLPGVSLWQPRKLFFRNFGRTDQTADVVNMIEEINAPRQKSYLDIATEALRMHKTQGMDRADLRRFTRGISLYKLMRTNSLYDRDTTTFFGGINLMQGSEGTGLENIRQMIGRITPGISPDSLRMTVASLLELIAAEQPRASSPVAIRLLGHWKSELQNLAARSCGIVPRFAFGDRVVVSGQRVPCTLEIASGKCNLENIQYAFDLPQGWRMEEGTDKSRSGVFRKEFICVIPDSPHATVPRTISQYNPLEWDDAVRVNVSYQVDNSVLSLESATQVDVAPKHSLVMEPVVTRIPAKGRRVSYRLTNYFNGKTAGTITATAPTGWSVEMESFAIQGEDSVATGTVFIRPSKQQASGDVRIRFATEYASDEIIVRNFDVKVAEGMTVGVIKSYDNTLEAALDELGVRYDHLMKEDLSNGDLKKWNTILVDIRAYLVREDLKENNHRLLEYVRQGGNLVVMYQRDQEWKPEYAPYPFQLTRKRVTVEEAPIKIVLADHALMSTPNRISDSDWRGWIQERGVYFPDGATSEYARLLSSNDPDEPPLTTGFLAASFGSGSYIYSSFVWYRQLKEMNAGAYRCFANMISYPKFRK
ncbi:MAG: PIG-L family deacetylase [Bacteroidota bacterium]